MGKNCNEQGIWIRDCLYNEGQGFRSLYIDESQLQFKSGLGEHAQSTRTSKGRASPPRTGIAHFASGEAGGTTPRLACAKARIWIKCNRPNMRTQSHYTAPHTRIFRVINTCITRVLRAVELNCNVTPKASSTRSSTD